MSQPPMMCTQPAPEDSNEPDSDHTEPELEQDEVETHMYVLLSTHDSEVIHLTSGENFTIGRADSCTHTIDDNTISVTHCTIQNPSLNVYEIVDSSSNGTYLDGNKKKIAKGVPIELVNGMEVVVKKKYRDSAKVSFIFSVYPIDTGLSEPGYLNMQRKYMTDFDGKDQLLGSGSFANVFKGTNRNTQELVAIKVVDKQKVTFATSSTRMVSIEDEFTILKQLSHSGIVKVYDVYDTKINLYIVLERAIGGELFDAVLEQEYAESDARHVFKQLVDAIKYLHDKDVAHRDLKPENVLIARKVAIRSKQVVKITDFGLSRLVGPQSCMQTVCGTPQYLAPEAFPLPGQQIASGYSKQVDMWSLGVILYIIISKTMPFTGPSPSRPSQPPVQQQIHSGRIDFPSGPGHDFNWANATGAVKNLIQRLLTKEPAERITPEQVLVHSWMQGKAAASQSEELAVKSAQLTLKRKKASGPKEKNPNRIHNGTTQPSIKHPCGANRTRSKGPNSTKEMK